MHNENTLFVDGQYEKNIYLKFTMKKLVFR